MTEFVWDGMMQCVCFTGCIFIAGVAICVLLSSDDTPLYVAIDATKISIKDKSSSSAIRI